MKLQVNTSGSWKTIVEFEDSRRAEVLQALHVLDSALGPGAKWCFLKDDGSRDWLKLRGKITRRSLPAIDFTQGHLNGYKPGEPNECYCFQISGGKYCGRAKAWAGHGSFHEFVAEQLPS